MADGVSRVVKLIEIMSKRMALNVATARLHKAFDKPASFLPVSQKSVVELMAVWHTSSLLLAHYGTPDPLLIRGR